MTRKDYVMIAGALRDVPLINCATLDFLAGVKAAHSSAVARIADALAGDNPRFDRERFFKAAGVQS